MESPADAFFQQIKAPLSNFQIVTSLISTGILETAPSHLDWGDRLKLFHALFMNYRPLLVMPAIVYMVAGCTDQPSFESIYTEVTPATLQPGDTIPSPKAETFLTVTGLVEAQQQGASPTTQGTTPTLELDQATVNAVGLVEYSTQDPFELKEATFRGVLMRDLLELWQVSPEATHLTFTALNDYQVKIPIELLRNYPIMLAQFQNGEPMQADYRGPAMLITPHTQFKSVKELAQLEYWIWQIVKVHAE